MRHTECIGSFINIIIKKQADHMLSAGLEDDEQIDILKSMYNILYKVCKEYCDCTVCGRSIRNWQKCIQVKSKQSIKTKAPCLLDMEP